MTDKCETCRFFAVAPGNECRRFPVTVVKAPSQWCGEHKPMAVCQEPPVPQTVAVPPVEKITVATRQPDGSVVHSSEQFSQVKIEQFLENAQPHGKGRGKGKR